MIRIALHLLCLHPTIAVQQHLVL